MTRIIGTNAQTYRPFRHPRTGRSAGVSGPRITPVRSDLVNDEPIEEIIFEARCGVDQRASHRGYVITEPVEEVLVERQEPATLQEYFWQGFSAPFMAQVIGQSGARDERHTRAYAHTASAKTPSAKPLRLTA
jgi:hypothetical protein